MKNTVNALASLTKITCCSNWFTKLSGTVYFVRGYKYPKLLFQNQEYRIERKLQSKTLWACAYKQGMKCKARLCTYKNCLRIYQDTHCHQISHKKKYSIVSEMCLNIVRWNILLYVHSSSSIFVSFSNKYLVTKKRFIYPIIISMC